MLAEMNIHSKKEFINSLRHKANHIFVLIITIGASLTKLFIDGKITKWFWVGFSIMIVAFIIYAVLLIVEIIEVKKIKDIK